MIRVDGKMTIREQVLGVFSMYNGPNAFTASSIAEQTGLNLASLSSVLRRMVRAGELRCVPEFGKRGGNGYYVPKERK